MDETADIGCRLQLSVIVRYRTSSVLCFHGERIVCIQLHWKAVWHRCHDGFWPQRVANLQTVTSNYEQLMVHKHNQASHCGWWDDVRDGWLEGKGRRLLEGLKSECAFDETFSKLRLHSKRSTGGSTRERQGGTQRTHRRSTVPSNGMFTIVFGLGSNSTTKTCTGCDLWSYWIMWSLRLMMHSSLGSRSETYSVWFDLKNLKTVYSNSFCKN